MSSETWKTFEILGYRQLIFSLGQIRLLRELLPLESEILLFSS